MPSPLTTRPLPLALLACALAACSPSPAPDAAAPAAAPARPAPAAGNQADSTDANATRLTVYSGDYETLAARGGAPAADMPGYALVDSTLHYGLKAGANTITLGHLPRALDIAAVSLRAADAGVAIQGQRYLAAPANAAAVIAVALGQRVAVEHTSGGAKQSDSGVLVAAGNGLTLALADGRTKVIREYDSFSLLDAERQPAAEPTLRWQVQAQRAGDARFTLSYPTGGLAWRAEYLAVLAPGSECRLSLDGAALVANRSGIGFPDAALTLVAGVPNRVRGESPVMFETAADARTMAAPPLPQPRTSGEYHAYPIPARTTLADGAIERVPLFARLPAVACARAYETAPRTNVWQPPQPLLDPGYNDETGPQPVQATVSFANTKAAGLGRPLPAGRVRVFDGADFLGESQLAHTPEGADIHLEVGSAFDLTATRARRAFNVDRAGRSMTEAFAVTVGNARQTDATVTVVEPLPRWSDWDIVASSVPAKRRDAQRVEFALPVAAGGKTVLTYTVRYRWPQGVTP
ncbi:DUF4139 domain-containing protein [Cognatiluteimonas weifangensis]|uniref:DUF4139 domain-containing protein n=1 Tax=Cognatiluteimonas weifangensis TaxID=2303539 RepID=UPI0011C10474|nr:DUF4139 domain-containing protein [Luteimonas weifangensis]